MFQNFVRIQTESQTKDIPTAWFKTLGENSKTEVGCFSDVFQDITKYCAKGMFPPRGFRCWGKTVKQWNNSKLIFLGRVLRRHKKMLRMFICWNECT
jgi:hypothetical protein